MESKIILVTGASSGIGKETALTLAKQGHQVIIHGRDVAKTKAVFEEIQQLSRNTNLAYYTADLSLKSEVQKLAAQLKADYTHLDILINNAGGQMGKVREETAEGHEKTMAINLIAPFLLTYSLLELLQKSQSARVVTVSSGTYKMGGKYNLKDIELKENYSMAKSYALSKLYVIWMMRYFVKYVKEQQITNVTFNCVEPGSVDTDLGRTSRNHFMYNLVYYLWKPMMWSVEKGAATSLYAATSPELEGVTGKFLVI